MSRYGNLIAKAQRVVDLVQSIERIQEVCDDLELSEFSTRDMIRTILSEIADETYNIRSETYMFFKPETPDVEDPDPDVDSVDEHPFQQPIDHDLTEDENMVF